MKMDKQVQVRMPKEWYEHLEHLAEKRAPGTKIASLIREAIQEVYFQEPKTNGNGNSKRHAA
jgi:predicted DNA-binding protein